MNARTITFCLAALAAALGCQSNDAQRDTESEMTFEVQKSPEQWREELTPEQYRILREKGTEPAFSGEYYDSKEPGRYVCAGCGQVLFSSEQKFDSGSGWPSFYGVAEGGNVARAADHSHGMSRTEVLCGRCGGHLGHVFEDGPKPTGLRYCINSAALKHQPE
jgi:peptide-methionine (R)-S-oxide reductase